MICILIEILPNNFAKTQECSSSAAVWLDAQGFKSPVLLY